jgi:hypothetical protein
VDGAHAVSKTLEARTGLGVAAGRLFPCVAHLAQELIAFVAARDAVRQTRVCRRFARELSAPAHAWRMPSGGALRNVRCSSISRAHCCYRHGYRERSQLVCAKRRLVCIACQTAAGGTSRVLSALAEASDGSSQAQMGIVGAAPSGIRSFRVRDCRHGGYRCDCVLARELSSRPVRSIKVTLRLETKNGWLQTRAPRH